MKQMDLSGLVGARICHDLANPLGAVVNGMDLLRELGDSPHADEVALVAQSAQRATAILRLHRLTFGTVRDPELVLARQELADHVAGVLAGPRVSLDWSGLEGAPLPSAVARLLGLMLIAGKALLGRGGRLHAMLTPGSDLPVTVIVESEQLALTDDRRRWLTGVPGRAPDSREVEFVMVRHVAEEIGAALAISEGAGRMALRATQR